MGNFFFSLILMKLGFITFILPDFLKLRFGRLLGFLMRTFDKKRVSITIDNIQKAFPEKTGEWHYNIVKESYDNLGITFLEASALRFYSDEYLKKIVRFPNLELINDTLKAGKGLILISGHYGNWELTAYTSALLTGNSFLIPIHPQKNEFVDRQLNKNRTRRGNVVVPMNSAAKQILQKLMGGGIVALLADQSATIDRDVYVDFFGRPAATYEAPASLALRYNVPIITGFSERQNDGTYIVELKLIDTSGLDNSKESIIELTRRHVNSLEEQIRKVPGQWSWQHRRWKHTDSLAGN